MSGTLDRLLLNKDMNQQHRQFLEKKIISQKLASSLYSLKDEFLIQPIQIPTTNLPMTFLQYFDRVFSLSIYYFPFVFSHHSWLERTGSKSNFHWPSK